MTEAGTSPDWANVLIDPVRDCVAYNRATNIIRKSMAGAASAERERIAAMLENGDWDSEMRAYGKAFAEIIRG
jgi:hypothetical protein